MKLEHESFFYEKALKEAVGEARKKLMEKYDGMRITKSETIRLLLVEGLKSLKIKVKKVVDTQC